jgi:transposase-like protein
MAKGKFERWLAPDGLLLISAWARDGLTDKEIAAKIGVNKSTFYEWRNKFPDFLDSLKKGKEIIDAEVENALLKNALGYWYEETRQTLETLNGKTRTKTETVKKYAPPNVTAEIFWLKNRKPADWRDRNKEETESADKPEIKVVLNAENED